jgi:hypothetical protein
MARITKRLVDSLRPKKANEGESGYEETAPDSKKDVVAWDDELRGFGVRFKPTGAGAYIIQYRNPEGRSKRLTLCEIRCKPATDSDLMPATVPERSRPPFRDEAGHLSC